MSNILTVKAVRVYPTKAQFPKSHARWKQHHDNILKSMTRKGYTNLEIAKILKRTEASVSNRKFIIGNGKMLTPTIKKTIKKQPVKNDLSGLANLMRNTKTM